MSVIVQILAVLGFIFCIYAVYIEYRAKKNPNYVPLCNFGKGMDCVKALTSEYSNVGGISNSMYGLIFYIIIFLLAGSGYVHYVFYFSIAAAIGSVYLAYVLYFKLNDLCIICNMIYAVNILILIFSYLAI
jgi:vitamin-K-epoxide reductase (warfarin-sensitive)